MMLTELFNNPTDLQSFIVPWTQDLLSLSTSGDFVYFFINFFLLFSNVFQMGGAMPGGLLMKGM